MDKYINIQVLLFKLIFILVCQSIYAQSEIQGFVKSSITGSKPITNVYIEITNIKKPILDRLISTDSVGFFEFKNLETNKIYLLKVSSFGYADQTFEVKTVEGITKATLIITARCEFSKEKAESDWKRGEAKLFLVGSIAPVLNSPTDNRFEKKFGITYYDFGCTPPIAECIKTYNERIFELMDAAYGMKWREKARADVEYLN